MKWIDIRLALRLACIIPWTAGWFTLVLAAKVLCYPCKPLGRAARGCIFRNWSKGMLAFAGVRLRVSGAPPRRPYVLVSNHLSYIDVFVLASQAPGIFISRHDIRDWPVVGFIVKHMNMIFVDRSKLRDVAAVNDRIEAVIRQGYGVVLFPESRTSPGEEVRAFRPAMLQAPVSAGLPVHYATLRYQTPAGALPASQAVCWVDDSTFFQHFIRLMRLPRVDATLAFGAEPIAHTDRKILAERLHDAVAARFTPLD